MHVLFAREKIFLCEERPTEYSVGRSFDDGGYPAIMDRDSALINMWKNTGGQMDCVRS